MKVPKMFAKPALKLRDSSPNILIATGIAGVTGGVVLACIASRKLDDALDDHKRREEELISTYNFSEGEKKSKEYRTAITKEYIYTGVKVVRLYLPAIGALTVGVGSLLGSNYILRKRNAAIAAAYAACHDAFARYRARVIEEKGEEFDKKMRFGLVKDKIKVVETDEETGKKKTHTLNVERANPKDISDYARYFIPGFQSDGMSTQATRNIEMNLAELKARCGYWNQALKARERVSLNEVYYDLGFELSKAGQYAGWNIAGIADSDDYIDFKLYEVVVSKDADGHILSTYFMNGNGDDYDWWRDNNVNAEDIEAVTYHRGYLVDFNAAGYGYIKAIEEDI